MKFIVLVILGFVLANCGFLMDDDQQTRPSPPANFPPEGYVLNDWVDQRGCNYIRTDTSQGTVWAPRVTVRGDHICSGEAPSFHVAPEIEDVHGTIAPKQQLAASSATPLLPTELPVELVAAKVATENSTYPSLLNQKQGSGEEAKTSNVDESPVVQVGSFGDPENIGRNIDQLQKLGYQVRSFPLNGLTVIHVLPSIGKSAKDVVLELQELGYIGAFITTK